MACEAEAKREARKEVLNSYFSELVTSIQDDVLFITNECLARTLITPGIHGKISTLSAPEEKATRLLTAISACMVHQEEGYAKFLGVLEKRLIYKELIAKLRGSLEEAINRKVTAECTDGYHSLKRNKHIPKPTSSQDAFNLPVKTTSAPMGVILARQTAIKRHMPQLKSSVQRIIAPVASQCLTKELITKETYQKVIKPQKPIKYRTKHLLVNVCNCIRANGRKFDVFMEILESRRSCKELVLSVQSDIKVLREGRKSELVVLQHRESIKAETVTTRPDLQAEAVTTGPDLHLRKREVVSSYSHAVETSAPITCTVSETVSDETDYKVLLGTKTVPVKKLHSVGLDPQKEREYHLKMAEKQSEAKLEDLRKKEQASNEEKTKLQNSVADLKEKMRQKDQEIERLIETRGNFEHALESLRVQRSLIEKEQNESQERQTKPLRDRIAELETKITELENEKDDLKKQVKQLTCLVEGLQKSLEKMRATQIDIEEALRETQKNLNARNESLKCTEADLKCTEEKLKRSAKTMNCGVYFIVVVGIFVLVSLFLHW